MAVSASSSLNTGKAARNAISPDAGLAAGLSGIKGSRVRQTTSRQLRSVGPDKYQQADRPYHRSASQPFSACRCRQDTQAAPEEHCVDNPERYTVRSVVVHSTASAPPNRDFLLASTVYRLSCSQYAPFFYYFFIRFYVICLYIPASHYNTETQYHTSTSPSDECSRRYVRFIIWTERKSLTKNRHRRGSRTPSVSLHQSAQRYLTVQPVLYALSRNSSASPLICFSLSTSSVSIPSSPEILPSSQPRRCRS